MHSKSQILFAFMFILVVSTLTWAQDDGSEPAGLSRPGDSTSESRLPQTGLHESEQDSAIYMAELRYRMVWQLIGFIALLGILHFAQVKLKIPRAQFWFTVVVVFAGLILSSYRNTSPSSRSPSNDPPIYAPTHAR